MTVFEKIKSMNIDEFTEWFADNCMHDDDPVIKWWDNAYCKDCNSVYTTVDYLDSYAPSYNKEHECAWCEVNGKCKYFQDMNEVPSSQDMIKLWLKSEAE